MARDSCYNRTINLYLQVLIPCTVIRIALAAPLAIYGSFSSTHWHQIRDNAVLHDGLYSSAIAAGEKIASNWGMFALYWNFVIPVPSFCLPPPLNLPIAIVDLLVTGYLSQATHYQTEYTPSNKALCHSAASSWNRPAGANESFFEAASRLNPTMMDTPIDICSKFVKERQYGIAIMSFYAVMGLLNVVAFFATLSKAKERAHSLKELIIAVSGLANKCFFKIPQGTMWIFIGIFYGIPQWLFRCLPISLKSKVRLGRRYVIKSGLGIEQKCELEVTELKEAYKQNAMKRYPQYKGGPGEQSPLSNFLGIYDMLIVVTEEMHYSDIISLSRVSKSVREAVLPAHDINRRLGTFKRYTCQDGQKGGCWVCDKPICSHCQELPQIRQSTLSHHLHMCRPYCTPCYKSDIVSRRPSTVYQRVRAPQCQCAPVTAHPNIFLRMLNGSSYYSSKQDALPKFSRPVCRECGLQSVDELLERRERRTKMELKKGLKFDGEKWTKCNECKEMLGVGPRWWVCTKSNCGKECRSVVHKSWGRTEKDDGAIV